MKARVKGTRKIVEVDYIEGDFLHTSDGLYLIAELEGIESDIDYWTRLEHTYAGMAMQGMANRVYDLYFEDSGGYTDLGTAYERTLLKGHADILADISYQFAHALVEKLKEKEERK